MNNLILNQRYLKNIRFGLCRMSYNGCEAVALHNALCLLGIKEDLEAQLKLFKGLKWLFGIFGVNPRRLSAALKRSGVAFSKLRRYNDFENGIYILSYWNRFPRGLHTVAVEVKDGKTTYYNADSTTVNRIEKHFICGYKVWL